MLRPGVYTVAPTPFLADGSVDLHSIDTMTEALVGHGVDGLLILGVMGEANKLLDHERADVLSRFVHAVDGAAEVIVGTSHAGAAAARDLTRQAEDAGATAVMVSPPPLARSNDDAVSEFFQIVASGSEIEIVLQDHPAAGGVEMSVGLICQLAADVGQLTSLKLEDPPTPPKMAGVIEASGDSVQLFGGLGGLTLLGELDSGSSGTMTGFAYPEVLRQIVDLHRGGDAAGARGLFEAFLPLILFESQPVLSLAVRKLIYQHRGFIAEPYLRGPAPTVDQGTNDEMARLIETVETSLLDRWL